MAQEKFQYEWYTIMIQYSVGRYETMFKAKSKENVIKRINNEIKKWGVHRIEEIKAMPFEKRRNVIVSVDWDSLTLDHVGYQRLF